MKVRVIFAALAAMAVAACAKSETGPYGNSSQEIVFDAPVVSAATKSAADDTVFPKDQAFNVYAHYYPELYTAFNEGQPYMQNVTVTYDEDKGINGSWTSVGKQYYWPNQGTLTFAAYSPISGVGEVTYDENGFTFKDFVVNDNPEDQIDLLFSERSYNQTYSNQIDPNPYYYGVQINFLHALSSIVFKIKTDDMLTGYSFKVRKIELLNVLNKGTFDQGLPIMGTNQITPAPAYDDWNCDHDTRQDYTILDTDLIVNSSVPVRVINDRASDLILIPQALSHDEYNVCVKVIYDYTHSGMAEGTYITNNESVTPLSTNVVEDWLRGKRYIYTLTLGLNEIRFSPKVETWVTDSDIQLPTN